MVSPKRPILRYHGGKWKLAPWIISHFGQHRVYCEPYAGGASVLLQKQRSYSEVYNDLDGQIVNLFKVLRNDEQSRELVRIVYLTPYSRVEYQESYDHSDDPVENARRTLFRSMSGFSNCSTTGKWVTGFRGNTLRTGTTPAHDWRNFPQAIQDVIERLRGVIIENDDALKVVQRYDSNETLFYIDPPYVLDTRGSRWAGNAYNYEMNDDDHRRMADILRKCKGQVIVSGYACSLYDDDLFKDWTRAEKETFADGARRRVEVIWINKNTNMFPMFSTGEW